MGTSEQRARELGLIKRRASRTVIALGLLDEPDAEPKPKHWAQALRRAWSEQNIWSESPAAVLSRPQSAVSGSSVSELAVPPLSKRVAWNADRPATPHPDATSPPTSEVLKAALIWAPKADWQRIKQHLTCRCDCRLTEIGIRQWTVLLSICVLLVDFIQCLVLLTSGIVDIQPQKQEHSIHYLEAMNKLLVVLYPLQLWAQFLTIYGCVKDRILPVAMDVYLTRALIALSLFDMLLFLLDQALRPTGDAQFLSKLLWRVLLLHIQLSSAVVKARCVRHMDDSHVKPLNQPASLGQRISTLTVLPPINRRD